MNLFPLSLPAIFEAILLLLVRVILAFTFAYEARFKLKDIKAFAKADSLPLPAAYFIAIVELLAAIAMLTGLLAPWAGVGIMLLMIGTISMHIFKWHSPYWANQKGWEYDLFLLILAAVIAVFGPGTFVV